MTAFEKVLDTLESLGIPIVRNKYNGQERSYIIFTTIDEAETFTTDNESEGELTYFAITYWNDGTQPDLTRKIKNAMKANGFRTIGNRDNFDEGFHGVILEYQILLWNHELDEE